MYYRTLGLSGGVFDEYTELAKKADLDWGNYISVRSVVQIFAQIHSDFGILNMRSLSQEISIGENDCNLLAEILRRSNIIDIGYLYQLPNYGFPKYVWKTEIEETHGDTYWKNAATDNTISCAELNNARQRLYEEDKKKFYFYRSKRITSDMSLEDLLNL